MSTSKSCPSAVSAGGATDSTVLGAVAATLAAIGDTPALSWQQYARAHHDERLPAAVRVTITRQDLGGDTLRIRSPGVFTVVDPHTDIPIDVGSGAGDVPAEVLGAVGHPLGPRAQGEASTFLLGKHTGITLESAPDGGGLACVLDLGGCTLRQAPSQYASQSMFSLVGIGGPFLQGQGPAKGGFASLTGGVDPTNIVITNGHLSLSSHHGIHATRGRGVLITDVSVSDSEVANISLSGVTNATLRRVAMGGTPTRGTPSNAYRVAVTAGLVLGPALAHPSAAAAEGTAAHVLQALQNHADALAVVVSDAKAALQAWACAGAGADGAPPPVASTDLGNQLLGWAPHPAGGTAYGLSLVSKGVGVGDAPAGCPMAGPGGGCGGAGGAGPTSHPATTSGVTLQDVVVEGVRVSPRTTLAVAARLPGDEDAGPAPVLAALTGAVIDAAPANAAEVLLRRVLLLAGWASVLLTDVPWGATGGHWAAVPWPVSTTAALAGQEAEAALAAAGNAGTLELVGGVDVQLHKNKGAMGVRAWGVDNLRAERLRVNGVVSTPPAGGGGGALPSWAVGSVPRHSDEGDMGGDAVGVGLAACSHADFAGLCVSGVVGASADRTAPVLLDNHTRGVQLGAPVLATGLAGGVVARDGSGCALAWGGAVAPEGRTEVPGAPYQTTPPDTPAPPLTHPPFTPLLNRLLLTRPDTPPATMAAVDAQFVEDTVADGLDTLTKPGVVAINADSKVTVSGDAVTTLLSRSYPGSDGATRYAANGTFGAAATESILSAGSSNVSGAPLNFERIGYVSAGTPPTTPALAFVPDAKGAQWTGSAAGADVVSGNFCGALLFPENLPTTYAVTNFKVSKGALQPAAAVETYEDLFAGLPSFRTTGLGSSQCAPLWNVNFLRSRPYNTVSNKLAPVDATADELLLSSPPTWGTLAEMSALPHAAILSSGTVDSIVHALQAAITGAPAPPVTPRMFFQAGPQIFAAARVMDVLPRADANKAVLQLGPGSQTMRATSSVAACLAKDFALTSSTPGRVIYVNREALEADPAALGFIDAVDDTPVTISFTDADMAFVIDGVVGADLGELQASLVARLNEFYNIQNDTSDDVIAAANTATFGTFFDDVRDAATVPGITFSSSSEVWAALDGAFPLCLESIPSNLEDLLQPALQQHIAYNSTDSIVNFAVQSGNIGALPSPALGNLAIVQAGGNPASGQFLQFPQTALRLTPDAQIVHPIGTATLASGGAVPYDITMQLDAGASAVTNARFNVAALLLLAGYNLTITGAPAATVADVDAAAAIFAQKFGVVNSLENAGGAAGLEPTGGPALPDVDAAEAVRTMVRGVLSELLVPCNIEVISAVPDNVSTELVVQATCTDSDVVTVNITTEDYVEQFHTPYLQAKAKSGIINALPAAQVLQCDDVSGDVSLDMAALAGIEGVCMSEAAFKCYDGPQGTKYVPACSSIVDPTTGKQVYTTMYGVAQRTTTNKAKAVPLATTGSADPASNSSAYYAGYLLADLVPSTIGKPLRRYDFTLPATVQEALQGGSSTHERLVQLNALVGCTSCVTKSGQIKSDIAPLQVRALLRSIGDKLEVVSSEAAFTGTLHTVVDPDDPSLSTGPFLSGGGAHNTGFGQTLSQVLTTSSFESRAFTSTANIAAALAAAQSGVSAGPKAILAASQNGGKMLVSLVFDPTGLISTAHVRNANGGTSAVQSLACVMSGEWQSVGQTCPTQQNSVDVAQLLAGAGCPASGDFCVTGGSKCLQDIIALIAPAFDPNAQIHGSGGSCSGGCAAGCSGSAV